VKCPSWITETSKWTLPVAVANPVVSGTRIRVAAILACYRQGMGVEEIVQQYGGLRPADVHDALAYAYDHLDEIEAALSADDEESVSTRLASGNST